MAILFAQNDMDSLAGAEADFNFSDFIGTGLQVANTGRRFCWTDIDTISSNIGPEYGNGGDPDGYVYSEASSPSVVGDDFYMEIDQTFDCDTYTDVTVYFKTNQRGDDNDALCRLQTNENAAGWVTRATFGGSGDTNKVATSGAQIWAQRTVDISALGVNNSSTRIRIWIETAGATSWHSDYGIDEVRVEGVIAATYSLTGVTKDKAGSALGSCEVFVLQKVGNTFEFVAQQTSNVTTGVYAFTGLVTGGGADLMVIAWKDNTPHVMDATDYVLQPTLE